MSGYVDLSTVSTFGGWEGNKNRSPARNGTTEEPERPVEWIPMSAELEGIGRGEFTWRRVSTRPLATSFPPTVGGLQSGREHWLEGSLNNGKPHTRHGTL